MRCPDQLRRALVTGLGVVAAASGAWAQPVNSTNLTPFTAVLGQPALRSASLPGRGHLQWHADLALASHSAIGQRGEEFVYIDGETLRLATGLRYQPADRWHFSLELPWFNHARGILDATIEEWHELTGLTNGERDSQGRGQLRVAYTGGAGEVDLNKPRNGIGDLRLEAIYALHRGARRDTALRLLVELPTGSPERLTGNGATDVSIDVLVSGTSRWRNRSFNWSTQAGVLFAGDGEVLPELRREAVTFGGAGFDWQWRPRIGLFAQIALLAGPWRSNVGELGDVAVELTAGLSWRARQGRWHLGFSEDLSIDRSPDFVLRLGWRSQD